MGIACGVSDAACICLELREAACMADDLISAIAGTDLTKLIHVIRGQHVMVDCDLAALYGVERCLIRLLRETSLAFQSIFASSLLRKNTIT